MSRLLRLVFCVAIVALVVAVPLAGSASAGGGGSISGAPTLAPGAHVFGGSNNDNGEFWKLALGAGDKLTIDYGALNRCGADLYLYLPSVTDNTIRNAHTVTNSSTSSKNQLNWTATASGNFVLQVQGCGYELTARVKKSGGSRLAGADSIAQARVLPFRTRIVSGASGGDLGEFWRLALRAGDRLRINYGALNHCGADLYVYSPRVTDYTVRNAHSLTNSSTSSNNQLRWRAPRAGRYVLEVQGCGYTMTATRRR